MLPQPHACGSSCPPWRTPTYPCPSPASASMAGWRIIHLARSGTRSQVPLSKFLHPPCLRSSFKCLPPSLYHPVSPHMPPSGCQYLVSPRLRVPLPACRRPSSPTVVQLHFGPGDDPGSWSRFSDHTLGQMCWLWQWCLVEI